MIKLITPPALLVTTAVLATYAAYGFVIGLTEHSMPMMFGASLSAVGCIGAALMKPWSRYVVYAITAGAAAKFASSAQAAVEAGFFRFQFGSTESAARSIAPELALILLGLLCCVLVWRQFRTRRT